MSMNAHPAPLRIAPQPSEALRRLFLAMVLGAAIVPFAVLPAPLGLTSLLLVVWIGRRAWRHHFGAERITMAIWHADGRWTAEWGNGACEAELEGDSYVSARVVVLRFLCDDGRHRSWVLLPDSLDRESFRVLRVRLRLEGWRRAGDQRQPPV